MLREFKQFIMRGNVVDLAVAVVIGVAFGAVVTAFVADIITPLIAAIFGKPDFSNLNFTINTSTFLYGDFEARRAAGGPTESPTTRACPECLSEIAIAARRCAYCTSQVAPA